MQYAVGILAFLVIAIILGLSVGWGLLPMLIAFGLGLMAYGLVDMRMKKSGGDNGSR